MHINAQLPLSGMGPIHRNDLEVLTLFLLQ